MVLLLLMYLHVVKMNLHVVRMNLHVVMMHLHIVMMHSYVMMDNVPDDSNYGRVNKRAVLDEEGTLLTSFFFIYSHRCVMF